LLAKGDSHASVVSFFDPPSEYLRPWKLATFAFGVALMIAGAIYTPQPDWDIPISIIMPGITYVTAPCSVRAVATLTWRHLPLALFFTWFSVDGSYAIYWHFRDPAALEHMRSANAPISLLLYCLCGLVWLYRGSLRSLVIDVRRALSRRNPGS
jgi:hypothetical protein